MTDGQQVGKDLEGNGLTLFEALFRNLPGGPERTYTVSWSVSPVSQPRFEPSPSRMRVYPYANLLSRQAVNRIRSGLCILAHVTANLTCALCHLCYCAVEKCEIVTGGWGERRSAAPAHV
jgi:hypothetical protein